MRLNIVLFLGFALGLLFTTEGMCATKPCMCYTQKHRKGNFASFLFPAPESYPVKEDVEVEGEGFQEVTRQVPFGELTDKQKNNWCAKTCKTNNPKYLSGEANF